MTTRWTWLVYVATHNNVAAHGEQSITRMRRARLGEAVQVLVQQDTPQGAVRRVIGATPEVVMDLGETDSGDPATLRAFVEWGMTNAPAQHYALVLWSHGSGWEPNDLARLARHQPAISPITDSELQQRSGQAAVRQIIFTPTLRRLLAEPTPPERAIAFDDGSGHSLDTLELGQVLRHIAMQLGRPLDLLVMNACQMASIEVIYQLRDLVQVYVASEDNMPAASLPYDDLLTRLGVAAAITPSQLGHLLVERYCAFYRDPTLRLPWGQANFPPGVTLAALRPAGVLPLAQAVRQLSDALRAEVAQQLDAIWDAHRQAQAFSDFHLYDLASFCAPLATHPQANPTTRTAAQTVGMALADPGLLISRDYTAPVYRLLGELTTYLMQPTPGRRLSPHYAATDYDQATGWGALLVDYHTAAV